MSQKTYADKLLLDKSFREDFEQEYKNLVISEKIAALRHKAQLTQEELAQRIHTTKSAISRYESNRYQGYSLSLLQKIAVACGADLEVGFVFNPHFSIEKGNAG
ncbi:MAG: helix-turn-helix transcriptional regulator [Candidatus Omnitrophota bacterium]